mmetsp:Transcript_124462/g.359871  ORF Transcript_124462/g.359871 Transcript_124462/m.359871 type:complete len:249 (-) Transcript_124462:744-1490(-)
MAPTMLKGVHDLQIVLSAARRCLKEYKPTCRPSSVSAERRCPQHSRLNLRRPQSQRRRGHLTNTRAMPPHHQIASTTKPLRCKTTNSSATASSAAKHRNAVIQQTRMGCSRGHTWALQRTGQCVQATADLAAEGLHNKTPAQPVSASLAHRLATLRRTPASRRRRCCCCCYSLASASQRRRPGQGLAGRRGRRLRTAPKRLLAQSWGRRRAPPPARRRTWAEAAAAAPAWPARRRHLRRRTAQNTASS